MGMKEFNMEEEFGIIQDGNADDLEIEAEGRATEGKGPLEALPSLGWDPSSESDEEPPEPIELDDK